MDDSRSFLLIACHVCDAPCISGKVLWTREESLASIVSVEMVDLPVSPILAKMDDEFTGSRNTASMRFLVPTF